MIAFALLVIAIAIAGMATVQALVGALVGQQLSDIASSIELLARSQPNVQVWPTPLDATSTMPLPNAMMYHPLGEPIIPAAKPVVMPEDLVAYIQQESEEWAKQDRHNRALELYAEYKNWSLVMQEMQRDDGTLAE